MPKALLITYNQIPNIPLGRHETGNVIVFSGDYGKDRYLISDAEANYRMMKMETSQEERDKFDIERREQTSKAEDTLHNTINLIGIDDLDLVEAVFIYVGLHAMPGAMALAKSLLWTGKKIVLFACDCEYETKRDFAKEIGCEIMMTPECGGRKMAQMIIEEWNNKFST